MWKNNMNVKRQTHAQYIITNFVGKIRHYLGDHCYRQDCTVALRTSPNCALPPAG
jgi:hypothetical protein